MNKDWPMAIRRPRFNNMGGNDPATRKNSEKDTGRYTQGELQ